MTGRLCVRGHVLKPPLPCARRLARVRRELGEEFQVQIRHAHSVLTTAGRLNHSGSVRGGRAQGCGPQSLRGPGRDREGTTLLFLKVTFFGTKRRGEGGKAGWRKFGARPQCLLGTGRRCQARDGADDARKNRARAGSRGRPRQRCRGDARERGEQTACLASAPARAVHGDAGSRCSPRLKLARFN